MKKVISCILLIIFAVSLFTGCSAENTTVSDRINIVATTFPPYDFTRAIAGDSADLTMLLSPETESHGFEPTLKEIAAIQNCDIFICIGGSSEAWVDTILAQIDTSSVTVIRLIDCIEPIEAVLVEGMESHEHDEHCEHDAHDYDEHIWTSPRNVITMAKHIAETLCQCDPDNTDFYTNNLNNYITELEQLDAELTELTEKAQRHTVVFADRFPFAYLANHYSLNYYAAFSGCSSDSEPSLATIAFLVSKIKDENIPVIFYIEFSDQTVADTICEATGAKKLLLHSCHNLTQEDFDSGITYLDLMRSNITNLREALN